MRTCQKGVISGLGVKGASYHACLKSLSVACCRCHEVMTLDIWTEVSGQTLKTQIRLL